MHTKIKNSNDGFSLVELIVVIVILAVLIGVTIGGIYQYVNKARDNTLRHNLDTIEKTVSTFQATEEFQKEIRNNFNYITCYIVLENTDSVVTYKGVENGVPYLWDEKNKKEYHLSLGGNYNTKSGVKKPDNFVSEQNWYTYTIFQIIKEALPDGIPKANFASDGGWILAATWNKWEDVLRFKLIPIYRDKYSAANFKPFQDYTQYREFHVPGTNNYIINWWNFKEDFLYFKDYK